LLHVIIHARVSSRLKLTNERDIIMKCPSCGAGRLESSYFDGLFACQSCSNCGGELILLRDFKRWQERHSESEFSASAEVEVISEDTSRAMICPLSKRLMTKYRISADTQHRLDLSPTVNAVWLDKGEWSLLKEKGLATKLSEIFTDHWQHEILDVENAVVMHQLYQRKFGDQYEKIRQFKIMIDGMCNRSEVIAYLLAEDPYSNDH
jgi:Zn-finger nucleic acid-binding protein